MFSYDPTKRLNTDQIKAHPWYNKPMPTYGDVLADFTERKKKSDEVLA
jgi:hypothetical protein